MIYYVSVNGNDSALGTREAPFKTINRAASVATAGDTVRVHGGTYREWVDPKFGGTSEHRRVVYEAVSGEHPIIKGSEVVTDWERVEGTVWKKVLPNEMFGEWNPYEIEIKGDWLVEPCDTYRVHLGDVYINGVSMFEAKSMDDLYDDTPRITCCRPIKGDLILHPELTVYKWRAEVSHDTTTLYCNFREYDPNSKLIEINVRPCCFYPKSTGINYITLRGFEIAHAACPWTPPTADQIGMVGPHWSFGWVIENNHMHDAKCSAISLGKEKTTGDNDYTKYGRKSAHRHQLEAVFAAARIGWSRSTVGSHIVRNNVIHDCGQNAVVGHMGCIFSKIEHNHIYNIGIKREFFGHEIAGIKFHGAIDALISGNNIHNCSLGTWLDWQAQGSRVTGNLYHANDRDIMVEVTHGPYLVDNNIFLSGFTYDNWAQGGAIVHNLIKGNVHNHKTLARTTPYHFPHSTEVAGVSELIGGDDRYFNNIFVGAWQSDNKYLEQFTKNCDRFSNPDEYRAAIDALPGDNFRKFFEIPQPVWIKDNAYSGNATPSKHEKNAFVESGVAVEIDEADGEWLLTLSIPGSIAKASCEEVTGERLGETRISGMAFEDPDGNDFDFGYDFLGNKRDKKIAPGPFATLKEGEHRITVWKA